MRAVWPGKYGTRVNTCWRLRPLAHCTGSEHRAAPRRGDSRKHQRTGAKGRNEAIPSLPGLGGLHDVRRSVAVQCRGASQVPDRGQHCEAGVHVAVEHAGFGRCQRPGAAGAAHLHPRAAMHVTGRGVLRACGCPAGALTSESTNPPVGTPGGCRTPCPSSCKKVNRSRVGGSSEAKPISALAGLSLEQQLAKIEGALAAAAGGGSQPDRRPDPGQVLFFSRSEGVRPPQVLPFGFGWAAWAHQISDWAIV